MAEERWTKMSKSKGNVVLPEEVVYGVHTIDPGYEFRDVRNQVIPDFQEVGVWQDKLNTGMFFTATRYGRQPVFLHCKDNPVPAMLLLEGKECLQHPQLLMTFWRQMLELYQEPDLNEPGRCKVCHAYVGEEFTWGDNGCIVCTTDEEEIEMQKWGTQEGSAEAMILKDNEEPRSFAEMDNEVYHGLVGAVYGKFWWARSLQDDSEGTPGSVEFNWKLVDDRETSHGDVVGFYHTHPSFVGRPSSIDYNTMKTWLISFGRPLLCLIEGTDGLNANWFRDDETPHVRGKIWKIGNTYFGIVPTFPKN